MITIRTLTFVPLILYYPENALFAFGIAQLVAAIFYTTSYYAYFHYYINSITKFKQKRRMSLKDMNDEYISTEFPFRTIKDFLPGQLENSVCIFFKVFLLPLYNQNKKFSGAIFR